MAGTLTSDDGYAGVMSETTPNTQPRQQHDAGVQPAMTGGAPVVQPRLNTLALTGFVLSFFSVVAGVVLGFLALSEIARTGERGRGLALAAIIISLCSAAAGAFLFLVYVAFLTTMVHLSVAHGTVW